MIKKYRGGNFLASVRRKMSSIYYPQEIQDLLVLGASIMSAGYEDEATVKSLMDERFPNSNITVHPTAIAGANLQDLKDSIDATLANYSHIDEMLVLVHIGGNDVTSTRTYDTTTQLERDTFVSNYEYIADAIVAAGFIPVIADLTFRRYTSIPTVGIENEEDGSLPYNENLIYPIIAEYSSDYSHPSGESILQFYNLMYNHPEYMSEDGVHPNRDGIWYMKEHLVETLGKYNFTGIKKYIPKVSSFPIFDVNDGVSVSVGIMDGEMPSNKWITTVSTGLYEKQYFFGKNRAVTPYYIEGFNLFSSGAYNGITTGDNSGFIDDYQLRNSLLVENGDIKTLTIRGLDPTKLYSLRISASQNSGVEEQTEITVGEVSKQFYTYTNGSANTLDGVEFTDLSVHGGYITFTVSGSIGNGYIGGLDLLETGINPIEPSKNITYVNFGSNTGGDIHTPYISDVSLYNEGTTSVLNSTGEDIGQSIVIIERFEGPTTAGTVTGDDSGFLYDHQLDHAFYNNANDTATVKITGLNDILAYTFRFSGSRTVTEERFTVITIDNVSKQYETSDAGAGNTLDGVEFNNLSSVNGEITFTVSGISNYSYLSGMDIIEE